MAPSTRPARARLGCGDGPLFGALARGGYVAPERPVCAVDLEADRLARVSARCPWIRTVVASAESVPEIAHSSLDAVCSTVIMEHVPDESAYLAEIRRILRPGGRAYVTTVFKRKWAWYFRTRDGESVLDPSHLREYTDSPPSEHSSRRSRNFASSHSSATCCGSLSSIPFSSVSATASRG